MYSDKYLQRVVTIYKQKSTKELKRDLDYFTEKSDKLLSKDIIAILRMLIAERIGR